MSARARIPVEFYLDEELGTWHFHVDEPRITGGGQATVEAARSAAAKAIAFALEGNEQAQYGGRVEYLEVAVG
jgi:hypothetical protein